MSQIGVMVTARNRMVVLIRELIKSFMWGARYWMSAYVMELNF